MAGSQQGDGRTNPFGDGGGQTAAIGDGTMNQAPGQKSGSEPTVNSESVATGGTIVHRDSKNTMGDVGCGSIGNSQKPFSIGGAPVEQEAPTADLSE
jgi:hypothetical protein